MFTKILFIGLDKVGEKIVHQLQPLLASTNHQIATITNKSTIHHKDISSIQLNGEGNLSVDLICDYYQFIANKLEGNYDFVFFIGESSPICLPLKHLISQKYLPYVFCFSSNEKSRSFQKKISIANIPNSDDYSFLEKITDLSSFLFSEDVIDWQEFELFLKDDCYQEVMPINIANEDSIEDEIQKIKTILELNQSSFNTFLLINNKNMAIESKVSIAIEKIENSTLVPCNNSLILGTKLCILSTKKITTDEIQLGLNFSTVNLKEVINERINLDDLTIPTFKRRGIIIDEGF